MASFIGITGLILYHQKSNHASFNTTVTQQIKDLIKILSLHNFLYGYQKQTLIQIKVYLKYLNKERTILQFKRQNSLRRGIYFSVIVLSKIKAPFLFFFFTTQGILTQQECIQQNVGGLLIGCLN